MKLHATNCGNPIGQAAEFYHRALSALQKDNLPFLIGGAYAVEQYTGIPRHTKDLDIFVAPHDVSAVLATLQSVGAKTERTDPDWLAKAFAGDEFIDIIFNASNGLSPVDESWFAGAPTVSLLNLSVPLCGVEEILWQKAFLMSRHRYDGSEVAHLLRARSDQLDWARLRRRFGDHWQILLTHLILFRYIYPGQQSVVPTDLLNELTERLVADIREPRPADEKLCRGTYLSHTDYAIDIRKWGYRDARYA